MENVQKIGHLELIQWWYLCPGFYGSRRLVGMILVVVRVFSETETESMKFNVYG